MQKVLARNRRMHSLKNISSFQMALITSLCFATLRLLYVWLGPLDLSPDEAQYWDWSRALDWSYYSKPPLTAWLIAGSTSILGATEAGVRLFSVLSISVMSLLAFKLGASQSRGAAWLAFTAVHITPLTAAGGMLMTPDAICTTLWLAALHLTSRIDWQKDGQYPLFVTIGLTIGLAGLAKYTAAAYFPILGLYMLTHADRRRWFFKPQVYMAGIIALLCVSPVFYWNMQNDWISFKHVAGQAGGTRDFAPLKYLGNFFGGQLGVVGPISFLFMLFWWFKAQKEHTTQTILWWFSAPLFLLFFIKAFDAKVQANWPVLATATALIGVCMWVMSRGKIVRKIFVTGLSLSLLVTAAAYDSNIIRSLGIDLSAKRDPLKPILGWEDMGRQISTLLTDNTADHILTTRYQTTGSLGFYVAGQPTVLYMNPGYRRQNHYDLQDWPQILPEHSVIYINEGHRLEQKVAAGFKQCDLISKVSGARENLTYRGATLYHCTGYLGLERVKPEKY